MKTKLWALGLGLGMAISCSQAFAWMAVAIADGTATYIQYNAATPEEAAAGALKQCQEEHTDCKVSEPVNGTAMLVAKGPDGSGYVSDPDPDKAAANALARCRTVSPNCQIRQAIWDGGVHWAALASAKDATFLRYDASSREKAEADALAGCRKAASDPATCVVKPDMTSDARLYYARATSATKVGIGRSADAARAKSLALETCAEDTPSSDRCTVEWVQVNDSAAPAPKQMARLEALAKRNSAAAAAASAPPAAVRPTVSKTYSTNVLRCTNQCVNGSCLRTFDNGRQERWQAPRKFDPINNNWGWDTTTNACGM